MPPRSEIYKLPIDVIEEINKRLIGSGFSGYGALTEWLDQQGYVVSEKTLQVYGKRFREEYTEQYGKIREFAMLIRANRELGGGDSSQEILGTLIDQIGFSLMKQSMRMSEIDGMDLPEAIALIAKMSRAAIEITTAQLRYSAVIASVTSHAANAAEMAARRTGASEETIQAIRRQVLGLTDEDDMDGRA
jgi:hypothetical protein